MRPRHGSRRSWVSGRGIASAIAVSLALAAARDGDSRTPAAAARPPAAGADPIATARALFRNGRYFAAESVATALTARARTAPGKDSLDYATASECFAEAGWRLARGMYGEAREAAIAAARIRERAYGPRSLEYGEALMTLGEIENVCNRFVAARRDFEGALAIREARLGPEHAQTAACLTMVARTMSDSSAAAAYPLFERALGIRERVLAPDDPDLGRGWFWLAWSQRENQQLTKSRETFERTLEIQRKVLPPDHPFLASTIHHYGVSLRMMNHLDRARAQLERALAIREKALGPRHPDVGWTLQQLGVVAANTAAPEGRAWLERAISIFADPALPLPGPEGKTHQTLGYFLSQYGEMREARRQLEIALEQCERVFGPNHPATSDALGDLGSHMMAMGSWEEAEAAFQRALAIQVEAAGPRSLRAGFFYLKLGHLALEMGQYARAESLLDRSVEIKEESLGPESPDLMAPLEYLAEARYHLGDYGGAIQAIERLQRISETSGRKGVILDHASRIRSMIDFSLGRDASARERMLAAIRSFESKVGPDFPDVGAFLGEYASFLTHVAPTAGVLDTALIAERITADHLRLTARGQSERQALDLASGRVSGLPAALTLVARDPSGADVARAWDRLIRSRALVLDEMAGRRRRAAGGPLARALEDACAKLAGLAVRGPGKDPDAYRRELEATRREKERIERELGASDEGDPLLDLSGAIGFDEVAAHLPEGSALVAYAAYDHLEPRRPPPAPGADAPRVPPEQLMPVTPSYLAFVLTPGGRQPRLTRIGTRDHVDSLVERWGEQAGRGAPATAAGLAEASYRPAGEALRRAIWDPVASQLGGVKRVFIVPDGALHLVNLATLPAGRSSYLVESGPLLHMLATERDLVTTGRAATGKGLLAIGGADFDSAPLLAADQVALRGPGGAPAASRRDRSECEDLESARWAPLPGTLAEARDVAALWTAGAGTRSGANGAGEADVLTGVAADETSFKRKTPGRRTLHLATHGFFLGADCAFGSSSARGLGTLAESDAGARPASGSAAATSAPAGAAAPAGKRPPALASTMAAARPSSASQGRLLRESPLLLSGLVLAGANLRSDRPPREDDGILTAEEIAALDLRGLEWAVLSACETGAGEVRSGEGVFGLRRAFQVAGAHTTIMSLWPVDDQATGAWMKALYDGRLTRGLDTAEAVRAASLAVLRARRARKESAHPFYWGAFVAAGDWR